MRIALADAPVARVIVPEDVQEAGLAAPPRAHGAVYSSHRLTPAARSCRRDEDLQRAADILNAGEQVAMLVGQGAAQAADEVVRGRRAARAPAWPRR